MRTFARRRVGVQASLRTLFYGITLYSISYTTKMSVRSFSLSQSVAPVSVWVVGWLFLGVFMVFGQVWLGGVTRLTGSGLSITEWQPILGVLPPLTHEAWMNAFAKYQSATTQYERLNAGMSLADFQWIYFWEYFHRLWARGMGFVFIFPFLYFWWRGMLTRRLVVALGRVILAAMLAAVFGWLMVATGLKNNPLAVARAFVNAYALSIHLAIGFTVFGTLWWAAMQAWQGTPAHPLPTHPSERVRTLRRYALMITVTACVQIIFGGWMSGMKAGLAFPSFPLYGTPLFGTEIVPSVLLEGAQWQFANMIGYDNASHFAPALIQVLHRTTAFILLAFALDFFRRIYVLRAGNVQVSRALWLGACGLVGVLLLQVVLGVLTLVSCIGHVPVVLGVLHQDTALLILAATLVINYQFTTAK